jgi:K+-transporting ATPase ATPase C chain
MLRTLRSAFSMVLFMTLLTGVAYPLLVTGVAQAIFSGKADGGVIAIDQKPVGASLIGQKVTHAAYFQGRPSAAGAGYDATASGGSNLAVTSQKLRDRVAAEVERLRGENPNADGPVPAELVLASASGLDPHVSPAAARWQIPRIATARRVDKARVERIVSDAIEGPDLGLLGEARVNVLEMNLALDQKLGAP